MADKVNRTEFYHFFKNQISPLLVKYEGERKGLLIKYILYKVFIVITMLMLSVFIFFNEYNALCLKIFAPIFFIVASIIAFDKNKSEFDEKSSKFLKKIKEECLNDILSKFGDLKWAPNPEKSFTEEITGSHNDVEFKIIEDLEKLTFEFKTSKLFNSSTYVFSKIDTSIIKKGFIILGILLFTTFNLYCHFTGKIELRPDIFYDMIFWLLIAISGIYYAINFNLKYKKTKLEDVNFNKDYIVKTDNEVEARYFLTTGFMERFKKLQTVFGKKNISCCAEKDIIRFTISKKDNPFEVCSMYHKFDNPMCMFKFYHEINAIFKIIDYFKLAEDTKI